jgi:hypothetical protein
MVEAPANTTTTIVGSTTTSLGSEGATKLQAGQDFRRF